MVVFLVFLQDGVLELEVRFIASYPCSVFFMLLWCAWLILREALLVLYVVWPIGTGAVSVLPRQLSSMKSRSMVQSDCLVGY